MKLTTLIGCLVFCLSTGAMASDVRLGGNARWSCAGGYGLITADRVENFSYGGYSGTLHLEVWAFPSPYSGSYSLGYKMMQHSLGQLTAGFYWYNISSGTIPCYVPPNGTWYVTIALTEYVGYGVNDGYEMRDYINTTPPLTIGPPPPSSLTAVEYFHGGFGHYFVTASGGEIAQLDSGAFSGWSRTGQTFKVHTLGSAGAASVCRFFSTSFSPKSSHFYTPFASECSSVKQNHNWQFEGDVFGMQTPNASGSCPGGTTPLYRLYNNGRSGAPNHRYTTSTAIRGEMINRGWVPEGVGALGVIGCVPY